MAKDITIEKEREREKSLPLESSIIQTEIEFDRKCEKRVCQRKGVHKVASIYGGMVLHHKLVQQRKVSNLIEKLLQC